MERPTLVDVDVSSQSGGDDSRKIRLSRPLLSRCCQHSRDISEQKSVDTMRNLRMCLAAGG